MRAGIGLFSMPPDTTLQAPAAVDVRTQQAIEVLVSDSDMALPSP